MWVSNHCVRHEKPKNELFKMNKVWNFFKIRMMFLAFLVGGLLNSATAPAQNFLGTTPTTESNESSKLPKFKIDKKTIESIWASKKIRDLVDKAHLEPGDGSTKLVRDIYKNDTLENYCAMVQLVSWFNDTSASETVTNNITRRGVKILPVLKYALTHPNVKLSKENEKLRLEILRECIDAIGKGEVIGYDDP
jgi:hypothetical protein